MLCSPVVDPGIDEVMPARALNVLPITAHAGPPSTLQPAGKSSGFCRAVKGASPAPRRLPAAFTCHCTYTKHSSKLYQALSACVSEVDGSVQLIVTC
jgi:hypothetical protein